MLPKIRVGVKYSLCYILVHNYTYELNIIRSIDKTKPRELDQMINKHRQPLTLLNERCAYQFITDSYIYHNITDGSGKRNSLKTLGREKNTTMF